MQAYFKRTIRKGKFNTTKIVDRIVYYFVYILIIRREIAKYVQMQNWHSIRAYKGKVYYKPSWPNVLYKYDKIVPRFSNIVNPKDLKPLKELVNKQGKFFTYNILLSLSNLYTPLNC